MHIHEAIAARDEKRRCIVRECWKEPTRYVRADKVIFSSPVKIKPTTSPDRCIVLSDVSGQTAGWQPTADDLTADDWIVVR